jgi:hypothetical protein
MGYFYEILTNETCELSATFNGTAYPFAENSLLTWIPSAPGDFGFSLKATSLATGRSIYQNWTVHVTEKEPIPIVSDDETDDDNTTAPTVIGNAGFKVPLAPAALVAFAMFILAAYAIYRHEKRKERKP